MIAARESRASRSLAPRRLAIARLRRLRLATRKPESYNSEKNIPPEMKFISGGIFFAELASAI
ncbi:hypothetical protein D1647_19505 [Alistipes sp. Z76]|nr:hypothetical protein [Alistipes sp. Z76]